MGSWQDVGGSRILADLCTQMQGAGVAARGRSERAAEGLMEEGLLEFVEGGEFARFGFDQAFDVLREGVQGISDLSLNVDGRNDVKELALLRDWDLISGGLFHNLPVLPREGR